MVGRDTAVVGRDTAVVGRDAAVLLSQPKPIVSEQLCMATAMLGQLCMATALLGLAGIGYM